MSATDTQRATRVIPLEIQITERPFIRFLRAEVNASNYTPFALIRYAVRGHERSKALRLDLDKRVFIDPGDFEESDQEQFKAVADRVAPIIAERVALEAMRWFSRER